MAKGPVEVANPQQYLRLLLLRLLETQKALTPFLQRPEMTAVRQQFQENAYILSEIRSWLEGQPTTSLLGPSLSTAPCASTSGPESTSSPDTPTTSSGPPPNPFAWRTPRHMDHAGTSQVRSSLPSGHTLPPTAKITRGTICFQPAFLSAKPASTSSGGENDKT